MRRPQRVRFRSVAVAALIAGTCGFFLTYGSDHSDAPVSLGVTRADANLTDLHAFVNGPNLLLALSSNPAIPKSATGYVFPTDVTFDINIDVTSPVSPADPFGDGGTILVPLLAPPRARSFVGLYPISEDIVFRIRFRDDGSVILRRVVGGVVKDDPQMVNFFAGLRDDPFIRGPRIGRNVASIVLEVPLRSVLAKRSTLLIWATSKVEDFDGPFQDLAGRALRSMFPEQNVLNTLPPRLHLQVAGLRPDVMIYNTALPAAFPNGRALTDDVVDLVCQLSGECRVLSDDAPFPSENDVPFLSAFPYLAPPHPAS